MERHLKETFGHNEFRPSQKEIICDLLNGDNVSVVMPTGRGKSLLYQFPATYTKKIAIIVSPLISLMNDQCHSMQAKGVSCIVLNGLSAVCDEIHNTRRLPGRPPSHSCNCMLCKVKREEEHISLIYTTPEWLSTKGSILRPLVSRICLIAVDEAHCISQWSHDFRPSYKDVVKFTSLFPQIPILTVTATATPKVLEDLYDILDIDEISEYSLGTRRGNLAITILDKGEWNPGTLNPDDNTIIYTQTRKECERIADDLTRCGINCLPYHAGMSSSARDKAHESFVTSKIKMIVATISFGMGIDKADVRHVINYGVTTDLETYYQEIGRAGRDGMPCKATMYFSPADFGTATFLIRKGCPNQIQRRTDALNTFRQYLICTDLCRQQMIDHYFTHGKLSSTDNSTSYADKCLCCDNCTGTTPGTLYNIFNDSRKLLDAMGKQEYGVGITKTLAFGKAIGHRDYVRQIIHALVGFGLIECHHSPKWGQLYKVSRNRTLEDACGSPVLMSLIPDRLIPKTSHSSRLYSQVRSQLSSESQVSEQMIMNDKVLEDVARSCPQTTEELWLIDGISDDFITKYGSRWLELASSGSATKGPKSTTIEQTMALVRMGESIDDIAQRRCLKSRTVENHIVESWTKSPQDIDCEYAGLTKPIVEDILQSIRTNGNITRLRPIMDCLHLKISWFQIRIVFIAIESIVSSIIEFRSDANENILRLCKS